jgi:hypothetical protein
MSLASRLGFPETFQTTLLVLAVVLALAPYLAGITIGGLSIPKLDARRRRLLRFLGPAAVACAIALVLPLSALQPAAPGLHLAAVDVNDAGEIDVALTNSGSTAALLTRIELKILHDYRVAARPTLTSSATYRVPIDSLRTGQSRRILIRHIIAPSATERVVIATDTARALKVQLRMYVADGTILITNVDLRP